MNELTPITVWNNSEFILLIKPDDDIYYDKMIKSFNKKGKRKYWPSKLKFEERKIIQEYKRVMEYTLSWFDYKLLVCNELLRLLNSGVNKKYVKKNITLKKIYYKGKANIFYLVYITKGFYSYFKIKSEMDDRCWRYIDHVFSITEEMKRRQIKEVDDLYKLVLQKK